MSGEFEDLHVCGYELRHDDPDLRATLADFRADRGRRIWAMADRLEELGFALDRSDLRAREAAGAPLGRPHLADAVLAHPGNAAKLRAEGIDGKDTLFPPYLVPGAIAYVARSRPTVEDAIEVIHAAGGVAVWAHPFWDIDEPATVLAAIARFAAAGLDGVEVFYPTHDEAQTRTLYEAARRARAARHRLGGLPRPRARALQPVRRLLALRARAACSARSAPDYGVAGTSTRSIVWITPLLAWRFSP